MNVTQPTRDDLRALSSVNGELCVTLTMPTDGFNADPKQGSIRIKNLMRQTEEKLAEYESKAASSQNSQAENGNGKNGSHANLLDPLRNLKDDSSFWRRQSQGLAVFLAKGREPVAFSTPFRMPEQAIVGTRFHVAPVLPFFEGDGVFYTLAIGKKGLRLFECSKQNQPEIELEDAPKNFAEIQDQFDHERAHHLSPGSQGRPSGGHPAYAGHGVDVSDRDEIKRRVLLYFQGVDKAITTHLAGRTDPLVLVALDYLHPIWRDACTYTGYIEEAAVNMDADILSAKEVYETAWVSMEPVLRRPAERALERFQASQSNGLALSKVEQIIAAATEGRVDTLLVAQQPGRVLGRVDADTRQVSIESRVGPAPVASGAQASAVALEPGVHNLVDLAIAETLLHGGQVFTVPSDSLPSNEPLAGLLRY